MYPPMHGEIHVARKEVKATTEAAGWYFTIKWWEFNGSYDLYAWRPFGNHLKCLQVVKQMKDQISVRNGGNNVVEAAHRPIEDGRVAKEVEVENHVKENGIVSFFLKSG